MDYSTKRCNTCSQTKPLTFFHKSPRCAQGVQPKCKECTKKYSKLWYKDGGKEKLSSHTKAYAQRNREYVYTYLLEHPCLDCGETDPVVLEFDHISDKALNVSSIVGWGLSLSSLEKEIKKCEVVCANCHRRRTARRAGTYKFVVSNKDLDTNSAL